MINEGERELLAAAQAGDPAAFSALYAGLMPDVTRFVRRLIGDGQDAEDVAQDTLFTLYMQLASIDPPEKLRPFVFRVARNRCYDILRRQGRFEQVAVDDDESDYGGVRVSFEIASTQHDPTPEDATAWLLVMLEVRDAMDRLPEAQRQVLILFCEEGFAYDEIAQIMDVSIGTVKSRMFHARRALRGLLSVRTLNAIDEMLNGEDERDDPRNDGENPPDRRRDARAAKIDGAVADAGIDRRSGRIGGARVSRAAPAHRGRTAG